jgi:hypothetical protein
MNNPLSTYAANGASAGKAMNQRDYSRAQFFATWLTRAILLEKPEDRVAARKAHDDAYLAERKSHQQPCSV